MILTKKNTLTTEMMGKKLYDTHNISVIPFFFYVGQVYAHAVYYAIWNNYVKQNINFSYQCKIITSLGKIKKMHPFGSKFNMENCNMMLHCWIQRLWISLPELIMTSFLFYVTIIWLTIVKTTKLKRLRCTSNVTYFVSSSEAFCFTTKKEETKWTPQHNKKMVWSTRTEGRAKSADNLFTTRNLLPKKSVRWCHCCKAPQSQHITWQRTMAPHIWNPYLVYRSYLLPSLLHTDSLLLAPFLCSSCIVSACFQTNLTPETHADVWF